MFRSLRATPLLLALCWPFAAVAGDGFYVESPLPGVTARADADAAAAKVSVPDHPARVIRRYAPGRGWEYLLVVEGFTDQPSAEAAGSTLAAATNQRVTVYKVDGAASPSSSAPASSPPQAAVAPMEPADEPEPEVTAAEPEVEPEPAIVKPDPVPEPVPAKKSRKPAAAPAPAPVDPAVAAHERAQTLLGQAIIAHGGASGGVAVVDASQSVSFVYRRRVPGGPTVLHTWARKGADRYLDVSVEKGSGTSSTSGIAAGRAWLRVAGGSTEPQDLERTLDQLERFSPDEVLAFALGFPKAARERREFTSLTDSGPAVIDGRSCEVLSFQSDGAESLDLSVDNVDHRVRRVQFGTTAGTITHEFTDWREISAGLVIPMRVRTWRDDVLIDEVDVVSIDLSPKLPEAWFSNPGT